ncbi:sensor histidine kinase [Micromonospora siamensis]|uniref:histidine kinase n=1 Tax=Micromonospora siamensis TaxID=299152 RepID=A0A1C5IRD5_9ACTN|nr:HAMP domain-containing sensor histidine kinase [Micromonospora siamensis]SCG60875.1 two-component system, OmpR family, sensor histidine kinase MtrB [Micromonospora siamensis]
MATTAVPPGRLRRRLVVAFVLVAGVSAGVLAIGSYLLLRQARLDGSVQRAAADTRYELVLAAQFVPLTDARRADLLASFAGSGRQVLLVDDDNGPAAGPGPTPGPPLRSAVTAGQLGYERRRDHGRQLLLVGGRIPGSTAQLYSVTVEDDLVADLHQLRVALGVGWAATALLAAAVGHTLARRTLEPVGRASRAARAVAEGLLDTRLPVRGRDEFSDWSAAFNEMAAALQAKIEELSRAQARERRFTADVTHELRTPVTALVVAASLLREHLDALPAEARREAELLVTDVVRLRRLVEELMEISRLDAGRETLEARPVDVPALLRAIVDGRGWRDRVTVAGAGRRFVAHTDPRRLERVLANLVGNAVEHGTGERRATVRRDGDLLVVTVTDQGPGIPADHLPHLFDRFYKANPARAGAGSGLGLAIARENARLLGARLTVSSEVGVGTGFRLELPIDPDGGDR